jgi:hypothetical protein
MPALRSPDFWGCPTHKAARIWMSVVEKKGGHRINQPRYNLPTEIHLSHLHISCNNWFRVHKCCCMQRIKSFLRHLVWDQIILSFLSWATTAFCRLPFNSQISLSSTAPNSQHTPNIPKHTQLIYSRDTNWTYPLHNFAIFPTLQPSWGIFTKELPILNSAIIGNWHFSQSSHN